jgi:chromosome segregation protein
VQITRLRLAGFKSFVEPTELRIDAGLTGVVGPNGCGKSNLVEALRWAMGESAARRMRAEELEDVIFAGTAARPARSFVEVSLSLDNNARLAPPPYHDQPVIEVVRRLARGSASSYRVNGRAARARDVQRMLADAATGARSTAIVAQGQIGAFVAAKPVERRGLLEEAAGVAGLYTRRQEAESRLKAAESNLERLEDVLATLSTQRRGLEKQARQARRFRKLREQAEEIETALFALRWQAVATQEQDARRLAQAAANTQDEAIRAAAHAAKLQADAAAALPAIRKQEAEAAAAWQRIAVERDAAEKEISRVAEEQRQTAARIATLESDLAREAAITAEAATAIDGLEAEAADLQMAGEAAADNAPGLAATVSAAESALKAAEAESDAAARAVATALAERKATESALANAETRIAGLDRQLAQVRQDHLSAAAALPSDSTLAEAQKAFDEGRRQRDAALAALQKAREREAAAEAALTQAENSRRAADRDKLELATEANTLRRILAGPGGDMPLLDHLEASPGYETALAAALGDDLAASLDPLDPLHWREGAPVAKAGAPATCEALAPLVKAPPALAARMAMVFVAPDAETAAASAAELAPGMRLVTRDGGMWRWDGFTAVAGAPTAAAQRLAQRNRLAVLDRELTDADRAMSEALSASESATEARDRAVRQRQGTRDAQRNAEASLAKAEQALAHLTQKRELGAARAQALQETVQRLEVDRQSWQDAHDAATRTLAALAAPTDLEDKLRIAKEQAAAERTNWLGARDELDQHNRAEQARQTRVAAIAREIEGLRRRASPEQQFSLEERLEKEKQNAAELEQRPATLKNALAALATSLIDAEAARRVAADRLLAAESLQTERDQALKAAEAAAADAKADSIRAEAALEHANLTTAALVERLHERLQIAPSDLPPAEEGVDPEDLEQHLARLERERLALGDVNMRADTEIDELEQQLSTLTTERDDLNAAIAKLRRGIGDLNRNARQKLLDAFDSVNRHFERLFTRLFAGGEAQLRLVGNDDPLEAGLEVYACPPGKKPQPLAALSGGERALTALSLLFAAFLTNPAPICVLDEVDAPLDDANVDRFCRLIEEIADEAGTRFLCITHHRLTMARMDRLYGVTMEERGVSHLVSVDLRQADAIRKPPAALRAAE